MKETLQHLVLNSVYNIFFHLSCSMESRLLLFHLTLFLDLKAAKTVGSRFNG